MTVGQLGDERVGQPRQRVVDRVADMAVVDAAAVGPGDELDDLPGVQRPIDQFERAGVRGAVLGDRGRDLAKGRSDGMDAGQVALHERLGLRPDAVVGALGVDHAAVDEPGQRVVEGRELLDRETIVGVVGVQEVEGVLEIDVMRMTSLDRVEVAGCSCR